MTNLVLIDSSAWVQALRRNGDPTVRARVEELLINDQTAWCEVVRLELWNGVRGDPEQQKLSEMDRILPRLPITTAVWELAVTCALAARRRGLTVPTTDLIIYACSRTHGVQIEHSDQHLELLTRLGSESLSGEPSEDSKKDE